eukprot:g5468.t1
MGEDSEQILTVSASTLKKPGYVMIKGQPCKIVELNQKPKATVKGNDRLHVVGTHVFTGKKYEDTLNLTAGFASQVQVPAVTKDEYTVMDIDASSGIVSVLTASGDVKDDLNLPKSAENPNVLDEIGELLAKKFEAGEELAMRSAFAHLSLHLGAGSVGIAAAAGLNRGASRGIKGKPRTLLERGTARRSGEGNPNTGRGGVADAGATGRGDHDHRSSSSLEQIGPGSSLPTNATSVSDEVSPPTAADGIRGSSFLTKMNYGSTTPKDVDPALSTTDEKSGNTLVMEARKNHQSPRIIFVQGGKTEMIQLKPVQELLRSNAGYGYSADSSDHTRIYLPEKNLNALDLFQELKALRVAEDFFAAVEAARLQPPPAPLLRLKPPLGEKDGAEGILQYLASFQEVYWKMWTRFRDAYPGQVEKRAEICERVLEKMGRTQGDVEAKRPVHVVYDWQSLATADGPAIPGLLAEFLDHPTVTVFPPGSKLTIWSGNPSAMVLMFPFLAPPSAVHEGEGDPKSEVTAAAADLQKVHFAAVAGPYLPGKSAAVLVRGLLGLPEGQPFPKWFSPTPEQTRKSGFPWFPLTAEQLDGTGYEKVVFSGTGNELLPESVFAQGDGSDKKYAKRGTWLNTARFLEDLLSLGEDFVVLVRVPWWPGVGVPDLLPDEHGMPKSFAKTSNFGKSKKVFLRDSGEKNQAKVFLYLNTFPQQALFASQRLQESRRLVFVTHGGASSISEALRAKIPMVTVPATQEQAQSARILRSNSVAIDASRAGFDLNISAGSPPQFFLEKQILSGSYHSIAAAVRRVAENAEEMRQKIDEFANAMQKVSVGPKQFADMLSSTTVEKGRAPGGASVGRLRRRSEMVMAGDCSIMGWC